MTEPVVLRADNVHKSFGSGRQRVSVLNGIDLSINLGEFVAVVGKSGSGKSTLLYCMSGLLMIDHGSMSLDGNLLEQASPAVLATLRRDTIGFVFQNLNLISALNVADNVALPATLAGKRVSKAMVRDVVGHVGLADKAKRFPDELSGGQRQRVAIARALLRQPKILFADEPTGSLDVETGASVMRLLLETKTRESTQIMVTHDLDLAAMADRVIVLDGGQVSAVIARPTSEKIFQALHSGPSADGTPSPATGLSSRSRSGRM